MNNSHQSNFNIEQKAQELDWAFACEFGVPLSQADIDFADDMRAEAKDAEGQDYNWQCEVEKVKARKARGLPVVYRVGVGYRDEGVQS